MTAKTNGHFWKGGTSHREHILTYLYVHTYILMYILKYVCTYLCTYLHSYLYTYILNCSHALHIDIQHTLHTYILKYILYLGTVIHYTEYLHTVFTQHTVRLTYSQTVKFTYACACIDTILTYLNDFITFYAY
jgi:hypothetical protein